MPPLQVVVEAAQRHHTAWEKLAIVGLYCLECMLLTEWFFLPDVEWARTHELSPPLRKCVWALAALAYIACPFGLLYLVFFW